MYRFTSPTRLLSLFSVSRALARRLFALSSLAGPKTESAPSLRPNLTFKTQRESWKGRIRKLQGRRRYRKLLLELRRCTGRPRDLAKRARHGGIADVRRPSQQEVGGREQGVDELDHLGRRSEPRPKSGDARADRRFPFSPPSRAPAASTAMDIVLNCMSTRRSHLGFNSLTYLLSYSLR